MESSKIRIFQSKTIFSDLGDIRSRSQFGGYSLLADGVMFALIISGDLYLRSTRENEPLFRERGMVPLIYRKRGLDILLRYFKVDDVLWHKSSELIFFARLAIEGMRGDIDNKKKQGTRLKDLPNINVSMERLLWQVGISSLGDLRRKGAKDTYLMLCSIRKNMGLNVLLALEGAIQGYHQAALPVCQRDALIQWFNSQKGKSH
jgi:DNA transformation protein